MTAPKGTPRLTQRKAAALTQPQTLTVQQAAVHLSCSESIVWSLLRSGRLSRIKLSSRTTRIPRAEVEALASGA